MVYALQKFRHYLLGKQFEIFADHYALKYLVNKPMLGGRICRWLLLFQKFDSEVIVKPGKLNAGPNHLSRITTGEPTNLEEKFLDAQLFLVQVADEYFPDIIQYWDRTIRIQHCVEEKFGSHSCTLSTDYRTLMQDGPRQHFEKMCTRT
jgi:hypothetical protein